MEKEEIDTKIKELKKEIKILRKTKKQVRIETIFPNKAELPITIPFNEHGRIVHAWSEGYTRVCVKTSPNPFKNSVYMNAVLTYDLTFRLVKTWLDVGSSKVRVKGKLIVESIEKEDW